MRKLSSCLLGGVIGVSSIVNDHLSTVQHEAASYSLSVGAGYIANRFFDVEGKDRGLDPIYVGIGFSAGRLIGHFVRRYI